MKTSNSLNLSISRLFLGSKIYRSKTKTNSAYLLNGLVALLCFASPLMAQKMDSIIKVGDIALFKEAPRSVYVVSAKEWKSGQPVFWICVDVKKNFNAADFKMMAYFYNEESKLLFKMDSITSANRITASGGWDSLFKTPNEFKKDEGYRLHFLIPPTFDFDLIKRAIFVYGSGNNFAWKSKPSTAIESIEFDEKAAIMLAEHPEEQ